MFEAQQIIMIAKPLLVAILFGMIIGLDRFVFHKPASMRTYAMVAMGSALLVIIGQSVFMLYQNHVGINPLQIAGQIVVGIGFLCTGVIMHQDTDHIVGLTTASGLWVCSAVGIACGFGFYNMALVATFLTLFIFIVLHFVEMGIRNLVQGKDKNSDKI